MKAKEPRISVRVSPELKKRIEAVTGNTGVDEATIVRNCLIAVCDSVEACGTLIFPLELHPPTKLSTRRPNSAPVDSLDSAVSFAAERSLADDSADAPPAPSAPGDQPRGPVHYRKASARKSKKKPNS